MALLALTAPVTTSVGGIAGLVVPGGTALATYTGFTVPWVPGLSLIIQSAGTAAGVCNLLKSDGVTVYATQTLVISGIWVLGHVPFMLAIPQTAGTPALIQVNVTTVTSATAYAFVDMQGINAAHCPIEMTTTAGDY